MTITLTVAGRIATVDATTHVVAGNTYPVTLALDSEWTGSLYLRVRFGGLYYDIPFARTDTTVDVQFPVGYPEVGIGVFSEALEICTNEARVRLLRSILEAGEQVVEFDSDLYDQWAGEVTTLLTDDAFDAESTRPVQNAVLTAWKGQVEGGAMTIGGAKAFTSPVTVPAPTASGHAVNVSALEARLADGSVTKVGTADVGSDARPVKLVGGVPTAVGADLALDSAVVHTTGTETIAGAKTFTSLLTASNMQVKDASTPTVTMLKGSTEVASIASDGTQAGLTASSQFFGLRGLGTAPFGQAPSYTADNSADGKIVTRSMLATTPTVVHTTGNETVAGTKTFTNGIDAYPQNWHHTSKTGMTVGQYAVFAEITALNSVGRFVAVDFIQSSNTASCIGRMLFRCKIDASENPLAIWVYRKSKGSNDPLSAHSIVVLYKDGHAYLAWKREAPYGAVVARIAQDMGYGTVQSSTSSAVSFIPSADMTVLDNLDGYTVYEVTE